MFAVAVGAPPAERALLLDPIGLADPELRREVESLLAEDAAASVDAMRAARANGAMRGSGDAIDSDASIRAVLATVLDGQYEISRSLGRGGMGAVYLARDLALDLPVAIKVLRPDLASSPENRERFRREARTAAGLRHPHIVPLLRYGEAGELWYFVMPHVAGRSLAHRLRVEGAVACSEARGILTKLADALDYAHRHNVIHRDIKPANILFDDDGLPMLADFGIAKVGGADTLTPANEIRGTPHYMSPEQLKGLSDVDHRSDLYSLGLVGYAIIVGSEPYPGLPIDEVIARRLTQDPIPLQLVAPSVPPQLAEAVMRCLQRDRALRYPDARTLRDALVRADCEPTTALPETVRDIPGFGQYALVWAFFWTLYAVIGEHDIRERILTLIVAFLVPLGFALHVWNVGGHGLRRLELARVSYWPPEWWGMWWPPMLRRPTDLWPRLPWQARATRVALSFFFVAMPALIMGQSMLAAPSPRLIVAEYVLLLGTAATTLIGTWWSRRRGLAFGEAVRVLYGATMPTHAWGTQRMAGLLAPVRGVRPPQHDRPADYLRAIDELVALMPQDAAATGRDAAAASQPLLAVITAHDTEIALLDRDSSQEEIDRISAQLARIGEPTDHETPKVRELRETLRQQLAVRRRMRHDREIAAHRREESIDMLRALWTQLCRLHQQSGGVAVGPPEPTAALRTLRDRIAERVAEGAGHHDEEGPAGS